MTNDKFFPPMLARVFALWMLFSPALQAAVLPNSRLTSIFPAGARQGTTVSTSVSGIDLEQPSGLMFSHPGITAVQKTNPPRSFETEPQPIANQFEVTIAPNVPIGSYEVRVLGRNGLSSSRTFKVSDLPEVLCDTRNTTPATAMKVELNSIVNCPSTSGDSAYYYEFQGQAGKRVIIHCEARSIDSRMVAMLELMNSQGNPVAFGRSTNYREPLIDFTPPADGPYVLKVYDTTYRAGTVCHYRIEFSSRPYIDFVWPPSGIPGTTGNFTLYGHNLPGGVPAAGFDPKYELEELTLPITLPNDPKPLCLTAASTIRELNESETSGFEYRLPGGELPSYPVFISTAVAPIVVEQEPNNDPAHAQPLTLPCEIVGRYFPSQDSDWFSFSGVKGETYSVNVYSERLNLPTDPAIVVTQASTDAAGKETIKPVKELDDPESRFNNAPFDTLTHDPGLQFTADADGLYRIQVRDLYAGANSHPRNAYRLIVRKAQGDFRFVVTAKELGESASQQNPQRAVTPTLRRGGCHPLLIQAYRRDGFQGPITFSAEGLPPGVTCPPIVMEQGQPQATLILCAAMDAPAWHGTFKVKGTAQIDGQEVQHTGVGASVTWDKNNTAEMAYARVIGDLALAVIPEVVPLSIAPAEDKIWETCRAGKLPVTARFDRHIPTTGNLKLEIRGLPTANYALGRIPTQILDPQVAQGTVEMAVDPKMAPGDYPCYLAVQTRTMYSRNPEAAQAAEEKKKTFEALIATLTTASTEADAVKTAAEQRVTELTSIANDPAQAEVVSAANAVKAQTAQAAAKAKELLTAAQGELPNLNKRAADLANASKPIEIELFVASPPLVIRVLDLPLKLTLEPLATVHQGTDVEIPLGLERLFDFQEGVTLEAKLPAGVAGLAIAPVTVPGAEQSGKLTVKTSKETPPGEYNVTIVTKLSYHGQSLQSERPLTIKVEAAK